MSLPAVTLSLSLFHCSTTGEPNDTPTKHQLPTDWTHVSQSHHITGVSFTHKDWGGGGGVLHSSVPQVRLFVCLSSLWQ